MTTDERLLVIINCIRQILKEGASSKWDYDDGDYSVSQGIEIDWDTEAQLDALEQEIKDGN